MRATTRRAVCSLISSLTLAAVGGVVGAEAGDPWFYDFSRGKPSTGLMEVVLLPGLAAERTECTLFRDGRVRFVVRSVGGAPRILEELETRVELGEIEELVDLVLNAGLHEFEPGVVEDRLKREGRSKFHDSDGETVLFRIELDSLAKGAEPAVSPFEHRFSIYAPASLAVQFGEQPEYQALASVLKWFEGERRKASKRGESK